MSLWNLFKASSVYQVFLFQRTCICSSFGIDMKTTLKVTCSHLYLAQIFPCTSHSKCILCEKKYSMMSSFGACSLRWKCFPWRNLRKFWAFNFQSVGHLISHMQICFQVVCMPKPKLGKNWELRKTKKKPEIGDQIFLSGIVGHLLLKLRLLKLVKTLVGS